MADAVADEIIDTAAVRDSVANSVDVVIHLVGDSVPD
jgi:hypothetical protein